MTAQGTMQAQGTIDDMTGPVLQLTNASLRYGRRVLWSGLDLELQPGEFVAVLGANGSGKTSLIRAR
jgi:zinc/manganese transport system ATP-binding protein